LRKKISTAPGILRIGILLLIPFWEKGGRGGRKTEEPALSTERRGKSSVLKVLFCNISLSTQQKEKKQGNKPFITSSGKGKRGGSDQLQPVLVQAIFLPFSNRKGSRKGGEEKRKEVREWSLAWRRGRKREFTTKVPHRPLVPSLSKRKK